MKKIKVVFIDSGVNAEHPAFNNEKFEGLSLDNCNIVSDHFEDKIGHGTSVIYNFIKNYENAHCIVFNIFENSISIKEEKLILALEYIYKHIDCDIINISCGVSRCKNINRLNHVCEQLSKKGVIIVSAFDNDGSLSYPACLSSVIGVDVSTSCLKQNTIQFVKSDIVNIRGYGYSYKLPTLNSEYKSCSGSSFVCSYISALVASFLEKGLTGKENILKQLLKIANTIYDPKPAKELKLNYRLGRCILFPFNKEMHALVSFSSKINLEIVSVYDLKYNMNIGKTVSEIIGKTYYIKEDFTIQNIETIDWDTFDTFIFGHTSKIEIALESKIKQPLVENALRHGKNVYLFDLDGLDEDIITIIKDSTNCFIPEITNEHVRQDQFGKLFKISKPVVGFFGTSPKQGKLTTQLLSKYYLNSINYSVGCLGTEPNSLLLGFDEIYNMGFNSTIKISGSFAIQYINRTIHNIELKNPDIIFVGSQSQSICMNSGNLGFYPITQYEFLLGTQPDAIILNVNINDNIDYILRTIKFLESSTNSIVLAIIVFPVQYDNYQGHLIGKGTYFTEKEVELAVKEINEKTNKPTFVLGNQTGEIIGNKCIEFFSGE